MKQFTISIASSALLLLITSCGDSMEAPVVESADAAPAAAEEDHAHDEVSLGTHTIGTLEIEFAQGHGAIEAGKEGHLVVKLPYSDSGSTVVRAWIGGEDRTLSYVGKGSYAASHDDYDVHASAPEPLAADAQWWVEVLQADGTKHLGSVDPIR